MLRQPCPRQRKTRIDRQRPLVQIDRLVAVGLRDPLAVELALQVELERLGIVAASGDRLPHFGRCGAVGRQSRPAAPSAPRAAP